MTGLTRQVLETALETELGEYLGHERGERSGTGNVRNGSSQKTVRTDVGEVRISVPRDRAGTFAPTVVPKHTRRLAGFDDAVLSLCAKGMTTGDIANHLADVYGTEVSRDLVSRVTDAVIEDMQQWQSRPLVSCYPVLLIDAIVLKIRDGQVVNRPIYVVIGVTINGERDILGRWAGDGSEGAKFWLAVLTEIKNRGVEDVCMVVCDGLKGLPESITTTWPLTVVQTCLLHVIRNTFRYASRKDWDELARDLRPVYAAVNAEIAAVRFDECMRSPATTWSTTASSIPLIAVTGSGGYGGTRRGLGTASGRGTGREVMRRSALQDDGPAAAAVRVLDLGELASGAGVAAGAADDRGRLALVPRPGQRVEVAAG